MSWLDGMCYGNDMPVFFLMKYEDMLSNPMEQLMRLLDSYDLKFRSQFKSTTMLEVPRGQMWMRSDASVENLELGDPFTRRNYYLTGQYMELFPDFAKNILSKKLRCCAYFDYRID